MDTIREIFEKINQALDKVVYAMDDKNDQVRTFQDWKCCGFSVKQRLLAISAQRDVQRLRRELQEIYQDLQECQTKLQQCIEQDQQVRQIAYV